MPKRDRGASLTDLLAEATGGPPEPRDLPPAREPEPEAPASSRRRRGGGRRTERPEGHMRASDGSYVRADGARRVSLQLKMDPDVKRALKVQAAEVGLSPAEYVARLVQDDRRSRSVTR